MRVGLGPVGVDRSLRAGTTDGRNTTRGFVWEVVLEAVL